MEAAALTQLDQVFVFFFNAGPRQSDLEWQTLKIINENVFSLESRVTQHC